MMEPRIQYAKTEGGLQGGQGLASKVVGNVFEQWEKGGETLLHALSTIKSATLETKTNRRAHRTKKGW